MNKDLQKQMDILMAKNIQNKSPELTADEKQELSQAYFDLFFGLAGANWARGEKALGAAWYEALSQIKAMIAAKDKSNPAAMYLNQVFAAHNARWAEILMTNPNKDKILELQPDAKQQWSTERAKQIGIAMSVINGLIIKYKERMWTSTMLHTSFANINAQRFANILKAHKRLGPKQQ